MASPSLGAADTGAVLKRRSGLPGHSASDQAPCGPGKEPGGPCPRMRRMKSDPMELSLFLAQSVVDQPALVRVSRRGPTVIVRVAPGEEGRLIGRQGRVIQAIRTLVRAAGDPHERVNVDLDAPRKA